MTQPIDVWRGEFGDEYTERNAADETALHRRTRMWARWLDCFGTREPASILEVGCNLGLNLRALRRLTDARLMAVEPNAGAIRRVIEDGVADEDSVREGVGEAIPFPDGAAELVFTAGVLIHVPPDNLPAVADEMHRVSSRFILVSEYFASEPEEKRYRGQDGLLFKRDFAGFFLDRFDDLEVVADGFLWKRTTGIDDTTWALMEKRG
ncbi:methyltransferase type 11 [Marinicauda salina]|uniref:Methyltransferase type 11 n=1 Tax=Marinicauda salina TaxID=2135793 RepID=A0A2U2BU69_9PROT|nr:pseudaminic acid biosynthesis-associated methylase [Marinicauda salina]PWE17571.1 methyltransferase type 11 [Marinicauda salina]